MRKFRKALKDFDKFLDNQLEVDWSDYQGYITLDCTYLGQTTSSVLNKLNAIENINLIVDNTLVDDYDYLTIYLTNEALNTINDIVNRVCAEY